MGVIQNFLAQVRCNQQFELGSHMAADKVRAADLVQHNQNRQLTPASLKAPDQTPGNDVRLFADRGFRQAQPDYFSFVVHADHLLGVIHVDHSEVFNGLVERGRTIAHAEAAKGLDGVAQHPRTGGRDNLARPGVAIPVGENLRQVATAHGPETVDADTELIEGLGETLVQFGGAQIRHALVEVAQKPVHVLVRLQRTGLHFGCRRLDVFDQDRLPFGTNRRQQAVLGVFEHQAVARQAIERTGGLEENLGVGLALLHFIAANGDVEVLQYVGIDQVFLGDGAAARGGHGHGQAILAQALEHFEQTVLDRHAMVTHMGQFKFIGALADRSVREIFTMIGLGQRFGLAGTQAQRTDQGFFAQWRAVNLERGLFEGLEAQAFGVKHGAVHIEDGTENSFTLEINHGS